jgi:hypothetical protein
VKKYFFSLTGLLFLLSACSLLPSPEQAPEAEKEPVVEKKAGKNYYTLRLSDDGASDDDIIGIGVGGRALTRDSAIASHEFFEVVFIYRDGGTNRVARAAWDIGVTPEISGVYRPLESTNYNYGGIAPPTTNGQGSALLFVGTKNEKTLLALGRLVQVGDAASTDITKATKSVTFEVTPLLAGVAFNKTDSRFRTGLTNISFAAMGTGLDTPTDPNTPMETGIFIHYNYRKPIPLFKLNSGTVYGKYNFAVDTAGAITPTTFDQYKAGILLKPPPAGKGNKNLEMRNPRYFVTDGQYNYSSILVQDTKTTVSFQNNAGATFENPVEFRFADVPQDGSVFALVFEIFVHNLTTAPAVSGGFEAATWRISTGMDSKRLDLDDGTGGDGGAIFLGSGDVAAWLAPYLP